MLSDRLRPNIECAPWIIDEVIKLENSTKLLNGTLVLSEAQTIAPFINKYMEFVDTNGNRVFIPTKTIMRMYSILEFELKRENKSVEEYYKHLEQ